MENIVIIPYFTGGYSHMVSLKYSRMPVENCKFHVSELICCYGNVRVYNTSNSLGALCKVVVMFGYWYARGKRVVGEDIYYWMVYTLWIDIRRYSNPIN